MRTSYIVEIIEKYCEKLSEFINKKQTSRIPGSLSVRNEKGIVRFYWKNDPTKTNGTYLPKSKINTIKALAQQDYDDSVINCSKKTVIELQKCIKLLNRCQDPEDIYDNLSAIRREYVTKTSISATDIEKWKTRPPYRKLGFAFDEKVIVARNGLRVRSKTEEIIVNIFEDLRIPYIFEYPITVEDERLYPDFLVLNVRTGKEYVYEHFGRLDDEDYVDKSFLRKIELYAKKGIISGKNLVMTFESRKHPLNEEYLMHFIKEHFL